MNKQGDNRLNKELICALREKVGEHDLIYHIYRNCKGKNKWSVICSAMDWIETCIDGISLDQLQRGNTSQASISFMTFVMCIDVMWEGIQQMHRVFINNHTVPFAGNSDIWGKEISDNNYWKEIRAAFAAHQTNLDGIDKGERRFASWSGGYGYSDFSVVLYSNNPNKKAEFFDISFEKIMEFAESRYAYLNTIIYRIDEITGEYCDDYRKKNITISNEFTCNDFDTLLRENELRLGNDYIDYRLKNLKAAFTYTPSAQKNRKLILEYRAAHIAELQELTRVLQTMDLNYDFEEENEMADFKYMYACQHIFEPQKGMIDWAIEELREPLGGIIDFDSLIDITELQVMVRTGWWKWNMKSA